MIFRSLTLRFAAACCLPALLAGCGGSASDGVALDGVRVAVIAETDDLQPDPTLAATKLTLPAARVNADWPQQGGGPAHDPGHVSAGRALQQLWSVSFGSGGAALLSAPVVAAGKVFTLDAGYDVRAYDAKTGDLLWSASFSPPPRDRDAFGGGLAYDRGRLFLTTGYAAIIALSAADGAELWRAAAQAPIRAAPTVADGVVLAVMVDDRIAAFETANGAPIWSRESVLQTVGLLGDGVPALSAGVAVAPQSSGDLVAVRADSGQLLWEKTLASRRRGGSLVDFADIRAAPVISDGVVYAVGHAGNLAAIDLQSGLELWRRRIGGVNAPLPSGNFLFLLTDEGRLLALTRRDGRVRWRVDVNTAAQQDNTDDPLPDWRGPILADGRLVIGGSEGELKVFSAADGALLEVRDVGAPIYAAPIAAGGLLYVQTSAARLVALR